MKKVIHVPSSSDVSLPPSPVKCIGQSGCLTSLGSEYEKIIIQVRESQHEYLTGRLNMSHIQRRVAGLCPLNAL